MNLFNYYWYFKSALTPRFCDDVIEYANSQKEVIPRNQIHQTIQPSIIPILKILI